MDKAELIGWFGNLILIVATWNLRPYRRWPFILIVAGEAVWVASACLSGSISLMFICALFAFLAVRNWINWGSTFK